MPAPIRAVDELGFPIPPKFEDFGVNSGEPRPPRKSMFARLGRWRWLLLVLVPLALFGKPLVDFGRGIVASVQFQRAQHDRDNRDLQRALVHAGRAIAWEPSPERRAEELQFRAEIHEKLRQLDESVRDCSEGIRILSQEKPQLAGLAELAILYHTRAWAQFQLGKGRAALDDCKAALDIWPGPHQDGDLRVYAQLLNVKAYISALTSLDVENGLTAINEALTKTDEHNPAFLDTKACLEYRLGKLDAALNDMDKALRIADQQRNQRRLGWDAGPVFVAPDEFEADENALAVMFYHRAEIHRKLASTVADKQESQRHQSKAEADFSRARNLHADAGLQEALEPAVAEQPAVK